MLPPRQSVPSNVFQDFTGGGYFYLDAHDRVVTATTTHHIYVIAETAGTPGFTLVHDYDLSKRDHLSEKITSALPDSNGLLWFVTKTDGVVGTLNFATGAIHADTARQRQRDGEIENSFAIDQHGDVYIATNRKLYRFGAGPGGVPKIVLADRLSEQRRAQARARSTTAPARPRRVMPGGYVNITDNADPMDVVVYRTARRRPASVVRHGTATGSSCHGCCAASARLLEGRERHENSLIVAGRAMVVENNYGYTGPTAVTGGKLSTPGFARVDLNRNGRGCHLVWTNRSVIAPTVVPKLSLANGLVYTYTKGPGVLDPWYWTALDFRTGKTRLPAARRAPAARLQQQLRRDRARPQRHRVPRDARRHDRDARRPLSYFSSAEVLPSSSRAMISSWICWVPSKMSRILTSRAHFSSSSPSP